MVHEIIFDVISAWQVIAVGLSIMIILPIIFYFASFDKTPVKIKRVPMKKPPRKIRGREEANQQKEDADSEEIQDYDYENERNQGKVAPGKKR